jgi:hypothetical protein
MCIEPECGRTFMMKSQLQGHIRLHNRRGDFICPYSDCKMRFERKQDLNDHMITHEEGKTYRCEFCNRLYSRITNLNRHITIHYATASWMVTQSPNILTAIFWPHSFGNVNTSLYSATRPNNKFDIIFTCSTSVHFLLLQNCDNSL